MAREADQLTPNYLHVNADGTVGAEFSGGILVPVTEADPPVEANAITFVRANSSVAGRLFLDELTTSVPAEMVLEADGISGLSSSVQARASRPGPVSASAVIIDSDGRSDFLQLLSAQQLQLALGTGTFVFTAGTVSAAVAIAHGLGRIPAAVVASCEGVGFTASVARGNPNNTFTGFTSAATTANVTFDWLAIG